MNRLHKATTILYTILLVLSLILVIWNPNPVVYSAVGFYFGALLIMFLEFPYINILERLNNFQHKYTHRISESNIRLMEELNELYESINKKKRKKR